MKTIAWKKGLAMIALVVAGLSFMSMTVTGINDWVAPANYKSKANPQAGKKDSEGIGKELFNQHCASCHGKEGAGDGKKAANLKTTMRELGSSAVQGQTDGELYYKSFVGRDEMPNFEKKITNEKDRWFVVNYMRGLAE